MASKPRNSSHGNIHLEFDEVKIRVALARSWSASTARQWCEENPALGQCNVTALLIQELFGGELLKTSLPYDDHFYNRIDGSRFDFTDGQFPTQIVYEDFNAAVPEIERGASTSERAVLRAAFLRNYD